MPGQLVKIAVLILVCFGAWFASVGFLASDDWSYSNAALGWLNEFPFVGGNHWSIRQTLVLPLAGLSVIFGHGEATLISLSFVYYAALLLVVFLWLRNRVERDAAWVFLALASATPGFAALAGISNVDVIEAFFMTVSLMAFYKARRLEGAQATRLLFLAGMLAGLAFLSRATAISLLVSYALFFLVGAYHARSRYIVVGAGAGLIYFLDTLYYAVMTGDIFYRAKTLLGVGKAVAESGFTAPGTGNLMEGTAAEPFMAILLNNEFGLTFFVAIALYWLVSRRRDGGFKMPNWLNMFLVAAVVQFFIVSYGMGLRPLPRYFSFSFIPALMLISMVLPLFWRQGKRVLACGAFVLLIGTGLLLTDLSNRQPRFEARTLAEVMIENPSEEVYASAEACRRAKAYVQLRRGYQSEVRGCSTFAGATLLVLPQSAPAPAEGEFSLSRTVYPQGSVTGWFIVQLGIDRIVPVPERILNANQPVRVYVRRAQSLEAPEHVHQ